MLSDIQANNLTDIHALHAKARLNCRPYIIVYIRFLLLLLKFRSHRKVILVGNRSAFVILFAPLLLSSTAIAEDQQACAKDPIRCSILTPLLYAQFSQQAPAALSKIDLNDCKSKTWGAAKAIAETLVIVAREGANGYAAYTATYPDSYRTDQNAKKLGEAMYDAWDMSAAVKLEIGDKALNSGCIEIAEEEYRYVLSRYTEPAQQGYQRRAAVGLEDIRSKRGSFMCSWFRRC
jgi:hypothetical protein